LLGELFKLEAIDEVHAFIAPKLIGGMDAKPPLGGTGVRLIDHAQQLTEVQVTTIGNDVYVRGRMAR